MSTENDHRNDGCGERESPRRPLLGEQVDRVEHRRQPDRRRADREVQPDHHERSETEADRGHHARHHPVAPPAIEKGEGERDENLHRPLGGDRVLQRQRQREQA